jgi:SPP1 family predicted phage head-tail adaptor
MGKIFNAGELNRVITFQQNTPIPQSGGQAKESWADAFSVHAKVTTTGGRDFYAAQKVNSETSALFTIRYRGDISRDMRIVYNGRIFQILPPINDVDEKHMLLLIPAKEVV